MKSGGLSFDVVGKYNGIYLWTEQSLCHVSLDGSLSSLIMLHNVLAVIVPTSTFPTFTQPNTNEISLKDTAPDWWDLHCREGWKK